MPIPLRPLRVAALPTFHELRIGAAIFSTGFLVFTVPCKIAIPILTGEFAGPARPAEPRPVGEGGGR